MPRFGRSRTADASASALRELRALAGLLEAGLLALDLASVAGEEALPLEGDAQARVGLDEGPRDAVAKRTGLAGDAAAVQPRPEVEPALDPGDAKRRRGDRAQGIAREVVLERAPVDPRPAVAGPQDDACDRRLALAGSSVLGDLCHASTFLRLVPGSGSGFCASWGGPGPAEILSLPIWA